MTTALEKIEKDAKLKKDFEKYLKEVKFYDRWHPDKVLRIKKEGNLYAVQINQISIHQWSDFNFFCYCC